MTRRLHTLLVSWIFGLTGVGTALLGASLPAVLHDWRLSDARGGLLLLVAWGGSTAGAFFARGPRDRSTGIGLACSAVGLLALPFVAAPALLSLYALFGLGLGITMTSISLMRAEEVAPAQADIELNRLNLIWALGAFCAPALTLHALRSLSITHLFGIFGGVLAITSLFALAFAFARPEHALAQEDQHVIATRLPLAPMRFCLFAAACVGLESGIGSWLTTYAERATAGIGTAVSANTAFWAGLLLSRGAHSLASARGLHTRTARIAHIGLTGVATLGLIAFPTRWLLPVAGLACGLGLGPLYPYVLSVAIPRFRSTAVFILAGLGASVTPWLTGVLSSAAGSLRAGLLAPAAVFLVLAAASVQMRSELR